jgi:V-type H+-transporting ATPase proteolipid subunit
VIQVSSYHHSDSIFSLADTDSYKFFGYMGITAALVFCNMGAAYGTAKSGVGICSMGVLKPQLVLKSILPVIFSGVLAIYGIIIAVILNSGMTGSYTEATGYKQLAAGLCCGLSSLAAGLAIGIVGDAGVRANAQQQRIFVGFLLILIFAEALGLYGLIIAIIIGA